MEKPEVVSHDGSLTCAHCDEQHSPVVQYEKELYICLNCTQLLARIADKKDGYRELLGR